MCVCVCAGVCVCVCVCAPLYYLDAYVVHVEAMASVCCMCQLDIIISPTSQPLPSMLLLLCNSSNAEGRGWLVGLKLLLHIYTLLHTFDNNLPISCALRMHAHHCVVKQCSAAVHLSPVRESLSSAYFPTIYCKVATSVACTQYQMSYCNMIMIIWLHPLLGFLCVWHMCPPIYSMWSHAPCRLLHGGGGTSIFGQWNVLGLILKSCCLVVWDRTSCIRKVVTCNKQELIASGTMCPFCA